MEHMVKKMRLVTSKLKIAEMKKNWKQREDKKSPLKLRAQTEGKR